MRTKLVLTGLLAVPFFYLSASLDAPSPTLNQIAFIKKDDGSGCKGAWVGDNLITASHCIPLDGNIHVSARNTEDRTLSSGEFDIVTSYSYKGFYEPDIAVLNGKSLTIGNCKDFGATLYGKECDLEKFEHGYASTQCHFERGDSGTVLFDEKNQPCMVYSGFYDIISKNKNIKIGVFKPLRIENE